MRRKQIWKVTNTEHLERPGNGLKVKICVWTE